MSTAVGKKRGAGAAVDDEAAEDDDKVGRCCSCACGEEGTRGRPTRGAHGVVSFL